MTLINKNMSWTLKALNLLEVLIYYSHFCEKGIVLSWILNTAIDDWPYIYNNFTKINTKIYKPRLILNTFKMIFLETNLL